MATHTHKQDTNWLHIAIYVIAFIVIGLVVYVLSTSNSGYVTVKYRDSKVNISASNFEPLNRSDSTVGGSWYDSSEQYMVIKLGDTYYHYCGMPSELWSQLKSSSSLYTTYQADIKGNYDCRTHRVPDYE